MPLTKAQRAKLHDAFSNAFNHAELAELVQVCFGVDMYKHIAHGSINAEVTDLIAWAGRSGKLRALVEGACAANTRHADLRDLCVAVADWDLDARFPPGDRGQEPWLFINVPPRPNLVVGRKDLLDKLAARLTSGQSAALSADGLPGVGKTTLAIELAHDARVQSHFTDGVLWAGLGPNANVAAIQQTWADALGADLTGLGNPLQRRARLNAAMADRRLLLVLDDAWEIGDAQALRGSGPHVGHILTTRNREIARGFAGAGGMVGVPVLADTDAWALLAELAPDACAADEADARALVQELGGLPLSIRIVGGALAAVEEPHHFKSRLQSLARSLQDARVRHAQRGPRAESEIEVTLEAVIGWSVERLGQTERAAFDALGAFAPLPATFGVEAACEVAGCDDDALQALLKRNLLGGEAAGLALHQEIAAYAVARTPPGAVERHRAHYLALADADREDWQTIEAAYDQIAHAWGAIPDEDGDAPRACYSALQVYFNVRGLHTTQIAWIERALAATEELGERGTLFNNIGYCYAALGKMARALAYYKQALALLRQVGDRGGEAQTLSNIGGVYAALGEQARALENYEQALELGRQVGDRGGEANALNNIGGVYSGLGEKARALGYYEQALPLLRQVGDRRGEATTLNNIGLVYNALGEQTWALAYYEQALELGRQVGDRGGEANTLNNIGGVYDVLGEKAQALEYFEQALPLRRQVGDRGGEATTLNNIGGVYFALGEKARALEYFEQALELGRQVGDRGGESVTRFNIGMVAADLGDLDRAVRELEQAVALDEAIGHPDLASDRAELERMRARRDARAAL